MRYSFDELVKVTALCIVFCLLLGAGGCSWQNNFKLDAVMENGPVKVEIVKTSKGFELLRGGEPHFVNGAGGSRYLDKLVEAGGNSIRTWNSRKRVLDAAFENGLSVCAGLRMGKPRKGDDYTDQGFLDRQFNQIGKKVLEFKDHPAILMWGIGNEVEHHATEAERILVWKEINLIAKMIKGLDENHPVITVIAGAGGGKLEELMEYCPELDAIGINTYGKLAKVPQQVEEQGWEKPYLITEFGPRGWWEVDKTSWGLPLEDTSSEKAEFYLAGYQKAIANRGNCLGSYVFLWGDKQEKTHTWFCLFLPDGTPTGVVDAMTYAWTGKWPANRSPVIGEKKLRVRVSGSAYKAEYIFGPNAKLDCVVDASDPEGGPLRIEWDLRIDVSDNPNTGGDREKATPPIEGAVLGTDKNTATIKTPAKEGNYRIFVYVFDDKGYVATANVPIAVREK